MDQTFLEEQDILRQTIIEIVNSPKQDLPAVLELVKQLKEQPHAASLDKKRLVEQILLSARKRADELKTLPKSEITARLQKVMREINDEAMMMGVAIDDEWQDD